MSSFEPHQLDWTPEHVRRFWDYSSTQPGIEDAYFAKAVGKSLVKLVGGKIRIGSAADIGCGRGDLIEILLNSGHGAYGVDQSPASVEQVQERFAGRAGFRGAARSDGKIQLPDASVDTAFMLEVVEHLADDALSSLLGEAQRIIRPGGHLVLTTPNDEVLGQSQTMCPECGSIFHRMQHVRSWSAEGLSRRAADAGFRTVWVEATVLAPYTGALGLAYRLGYRAIRKRNPHLVYIGERTA
jgi:2-polyprenyl-3-methyl-5-hydroxy-6-metoxy-1,4-benzoquinol methylase